MTDQNHNFEIETALIHFKSAFDGAVINRYSHEDSGSSGISGGTVKQKLKVNYVFGPKQRILADLEGKQDTVKFPIVAICPTGMGRDDQRVKNKNDNLRVRLPDGNYGNYQVVPWNISVSLSIMAKYQEDVTQIISNFAVMANPYIIFSWKEPKTGREVNAEVFWDGQIPIEYPGASSDLAANAPFRIMATANFVIKTYLYRTEIENTAKICKIDTDIIVPHKFYCNYESLSEPANINSIDMYTILGKPQLRYVDQWLFKTSDTPNIHVTGDGFALTDAVFVSGSNPNMYTHNTYTYYDQTVTGYRVPEFKIIDAQNLSFNLPPSSALGFTDIIVVNECGIGTLTDGANRCNRVENPYDPTHAEYYEWQVLQYPYLNGLIVSNDHNGGFVIDYNQEIVYYEECGDHTDGNQMINIAAILSAGNHLVSCDPRITVRTLPTSVSATNVIGLVSAFNTFLYTSVLSNSANWESVFSTVQSYSSLWAMSGYDGGPILGDLDVYGNILSAGVNLYDIFLTSSTDAQTLTYNDSTGELSISNGNSVSLSSLSSSANIVETDPVFELWAQTYSANYDDAFTTIRDNSALFLAHVDLSDIISVSANWNSVFNAVTDLSSNWQSTFSTFATQSANNISGYTTVHSNSADWNYQGSDLKSLSSNWQNTYSNFTTQSANNISGYTTVHSNSADWTQSLGYDENGSILNISNGNSVVLSALGVESDPLFTTWAQTYSAELYSIYSGFSGISPSTLISGSGTNGNIVLWGPDNVLGDTDVSLVRLTNTLSTGIVSGGKLTINSSDNTKFDISDGTGLIVDSYSDPDAPQIYNVVWSGLTAVDVTELANRSASHILIDGNGQILQYGSVPTGSDRRDNIYLGVLGHTNRVNIANAINVPDFLPHPISQIRDLAEAIGIINHGNIVTPNGANMQLNKSVGTLYKDGGNFHTNNKIPSLVTIGATVGDTFRYRTQTGAGATTTDISPNFYDDGGVITAISGTRSTNQRIFLTLSGNMVIQYGQVVYNTMAAAIDALPSELFVKFGNLANIGILIGVLTVQTNASSLMDTSRARFLNPSKFGETSTGIGGGASGGGLGSLQNSYENSVEPEIITNETRGALSIKRGSLYDSDNVLEVLNGSDASTAFITGEGNATFNTLTTSSLSANTLTVLTGPVVYPIDNISTNYTVLETDYTLNCSNTILLILPPVGGTQGRMYNIKNSGTGVVTISANGSDKIDGSNPYVISTRYESLSIQSDNTGWIII